MTGLLAYIWMLYDMGLTLIVAVFTPNPWEAARRFLTVIGFVQLAYRLAKLKVNKVRKPKRKKKNRKGKRQSRKR